MNKTILVIYNDILFHSEDLGLGNITKQVNINGMRLFTQKEWLEFQNKVEKLEDIEWYYDTHDVMEYSNGFDLLDRMSVKSISDESILATLDSLMINNDSFGFFPNIEDL